MDKMSEVKSPEENRSDDSGLKNQPQAIEEAEFLDKVIAFAILILPYCLFYGWVQDLVLAYAPSANVMTLLFTIIIFLLLVGKSARMIHAFRLKRRQGHSGGVQ
jgi:hypothetical protein